MDLTFFVDENIGIKLVTGLRDLGYSNIVHLEEFFPKGTDDETWLNFIGERGYVLITKDKRVRKNPKEKEALLRHCIVAFYLGGNEVGIKGVSKQIINAWDKMEACARRQKKKGTAGIFRVPPNRGELIEIPIKE